MAECIQGYVVGPDTSLIGEPDFLRSGLVSPWQATPLWGGMGITPQLPPPGMSGPALALATAANNLRAFTTFTGSDALVSYGEQCAPAARAGEGTITQMGRVLPLPGGAINFVALGSGAQIWLKYPQAITKQLITGSMIRQLYWDWINQQLLVSPANPGDVPISVMVLAVNSQGDAQVITAAGTWESGYAALVEI